VDWAFCRQNSCFGEWISTAYLLFSHEIIIELNKNTWICDWSSGYKCCRIQNTTGMMVKSNFCFYKGTHDLKKKKERKKYFISKPIDGRKIQYLSEINTFRIE